MPVKILLQEMTSADIAECMAFDQLKDKDYADGIKAEMMTDEERNTAIDKLFGF